MDRASVKDLPAGPSTKQAVRRFVKEIKEGPDHPIEKIILYGSTARGQATAGSDVDLLVIWDGPVQDALDTLIPITTDILVETGVDLSVHPVAPDDFETIRRIRTGFYENVEREGIVVA